MNNYKKVGFTCGVFDLFNAGHILMLKKCKKRCEYLVVGIQTDPTIDRPNKNKPVQSIFERQIQVNACKYVDKVIVYETEQDLEDILDTQDIDVRFVGKDHDPSNFNNFITGIDICKKRQIQILILERGGRFSSSELRERIKNDNK